MSIDTDFERREPETCGISPACGGIARQSSPYFDHDAGRWQRSASEFLLPSSVTRMTVNIEQVKFAEVVERQ